MNERRPRQWRERIYYLSALDTEPNLNVQLDFMAYTIRVDNPTGVWWFIPAAGQWIAPQTINVVIRLQGTQAGQVTLQTPVGHVSAPEAGALTVVKFSERYETPSPGIHFDDDRPVGNAFDVSPSDTVDLPGITRAIYVGTGGDVEVMMAADNAVVIYVGVVAGTMLPIRARRVLAGNTTASNIVGVF